tara:strand:+ start:276 stop:509 length:234 start_codon:yes stop_codon:yes gene_type:complete
MLLSIKLQVSPILASDANSILISKSSNFLHSTLNSNPFLPSDNFSLSSTYDIISPVNAICPFNLIPCDSSSKEDNEN